MFSLKNKKALVTGGSRGIGKGIVLCLAEQGADVAVNYYSKANKAENVVTKVKKMGSASFSIHTSLRLQSISIIRSPLRLRNKTETKIPG